ncbi:MAG: phosphoribosylformylglycinamidine synthase subunit PurQ [Neomegalonema sp.]|nr:phosphoribosylformylglycinamidine synthase subunit PurQ [Neomegalonema sp.]
MKAAVVVFPGSNCDRDMMVALEQATGVRPARAWHKDADLPAGVDLVALPGGFSFGDYLRPGAIAARAPIMEAVCAHAARGGYVLGVCNGWQTLIELGLLPGALLRNAGLNFICREAQLRVERADTVFTARYQQGELIRSYIAHHDGNFFASDDEVAALEDQGRVAVRYVDADGEASATGNPNGSVRNIAGVYSENLRVLGMMPHPERSADAVLGGSDGARLFEAIAAA